MRVAFYLPVVTPWWFVQKLIPLIRSVARDAEVFVLVPPLWRNTGIGPAELAHCADLDHVNWLILDGAEHPTLRFWAADQADLLALVEDIAPDYTICRSADLETPRRFPGVVRWLMEAAVPPFTQFPTCQFADTLFDHGLMAPLDARQRERLDAMFAPAWREQHEQFAGWDRASFLEAAGLPADKLLIGLPLEYEHEEIFFHQHNVIGDNVAMIDHIVAKMGDEMVLAVTNHPLNDLYCDNRVLHAAIAAHGEKVRLVEPIEGRPSATLQLAKHCRGMAVGNSKTFGAAVFFGTPMLRLSSFRSGDWMNAYSEFDPFAAAIRSGQARGADEADARLWFAYHYLNNSFDAADPSLTAAEVVDRMTNPVNEERWARALAYGTPDLQPA